MSEVYEIVRVLDKKHLRNSESQLHDYQLGRGRGLAPGYYVVVWGSSAVKNLKYDASAAWHGPYGSRRSAMVMVGILWTAPKSPSTESSMLRGGTAVA
jgi:hypothetical protein